MGSHGPHSSNPLTYFPGPFLFLEPLKIHKLRKLTDGACGIFVSYLNL